MKEQTTTDITRLLGDKKIFVFHISTAFIDDDMVESHVEYVRKNNKLELFDDVVCLYITNNDSTPIRIEKF